VAAGSDTASLLGSPTPAWFASAADTPQIAAILGYSELLADTLSHRRTATTPKAIHQRIHYAQAAVISFHFHRSPLLYSGTHHG
jgi:hypothetical protein